MYERRMIDEGMERGVGAIDSEDLIDVWFVIDTKNTPVVVDMTLGFTKEKDWFWGSRCQSNSEQR